jgi:hypothetical protein
MSESRERAARKAEAARKRAAYEATIAARVEATRLAAATAEAEAQVIEAAHVAALAVAAPATSSSSGGRVTRSSNSASSSSSRAMGLDPPQFDAPVFATSISEAARVSALAAAAPDASRSSGGSMTLDSSVISLLRMGPEPPSIHAEFLADGVALDRRDRLRVANFEAGAAAARKFVAAAFRLPLMPNVLAHFFDCL